VQIVVQQIKETAEAQPALPPAVIVRDALVGASQRVLSQMPLRENLRQTISRERRKKLPPNAKSLEDLQELPTEYTKTTLDEQFVLSRTTKAGRSTSPRGRILSRCVAARSGSSTVLLK